MRYIPPRRCALVARLLESSVLRVVSTRGGFMNFSKWFLSLVLLGLSSSLAMADSVDPKFVPIGGGGSIILNSPNDPAFTFSYLFGVTQTVDCGQVSGSFSDAGFTCIDPANTNTEFVNNSGKAWNSLTLEFTSITGGLAF